MGVGGIVDDESRDADCRYVMARRRSPDEVLIRALITAGFASMCSVVAIYESREKEDFESSGVNRNLEQRDARGSMILMICYTMMRELRQDHGAPSDIVAHKTESCNSSICFHYSAERPLSILRHGIGFVKDDDFVGRTWV